MFDNATGEANHWVRIDAVSLSLILGSWGAFGWYLQMVDGQTGPTIYAGWLLITLALAGQFMASMAAAQVRRAKNKELDTAKSLWFIAAIGFSAYSAFSASHAWEVSGAAGFTNDTGNACITALFWFLAAVEPWLAWGIEAVEQAPLPEKAPAPAPAPAAVNAPHAATSPQLTSEPVMTHDAMGRLVRVQTSKMEPSSIAKVRGIIEAASPVKLASVASAVAGAFAIFSLGQATPAQAAPFRFEDQADAPNAASAAQGAFDFLTESARAQAKAKFFNRDAAKNYALELLLTKGLNDCAIAEQTGLHRLVVLRMRHRLQAWLAVQEAAEAA